MSSQEEGPHQKNDRPKGFGADEGTAGQWREQVSRCQETATPVEKTYKTRGRQAGQQENWGFSFPSLSERKGP